MAVFFEYVYYVGTSEMFKNFILGSVRCFFPVGIGKLPDAVHTSAMDIHPRCHVDLSGPRLRYFPNTLY